MTARREPSDPLIAEYFGGRMLQGRRRELRDRLIVWMAADGVRLSTIAERFGLARTYVATIIGRMRAAQQTGASEEKKSATPPEGGA